MSRLVARLARLESARDVATAEQGRQLADDPAAPPLLERLAELCGAVPLPHPQAGTRLPPLGRADEWHCRDLAFEFNLPLGDVRHELHVITQGCRALANDPEVRGIMRELGAIERRLRAHD